VSLGYAGTVGNGWQLEGLDVGYTFSVRAAMLRSVSIGTRLGVFSDHGMVNGGGSRGFLGAAVLQGRTGRLRLADVGSETNPGIIGLDLTVEAIAYGSANSPLPVGSPWGALSILPGIRFGRDNGMRGGVVAGPSFFFGDASSVQAFVGLRIDLPVSSGRPSH
jgi:hypothetical protein